MATKDGRVLHSKKYGKNSVVTDESDHKDRKNCVEKDSVHKNAKKSEKQMVLQ